MRLKPYIWKRLACCKVSLFIRWMDTACSCSSIQMLLFALFGFFISAQRVFKSQNYLGQRWTSAQKKRSSLVHSQKSKGQIKDNKCPKAVSILFSGKEYLTLTAVPRPREQLAHHHCESSSPVDIPCSSSLLTPRCFSQSHPNDEPRPSPCNWGLCRPRLRCAGQARALCAALASLPEGTTCARWLQGRVPPAPGLHPPLASPCCARARGDAQTKYQSWYIFPTNRQNDVFSAARKQSQFLYEQCINCLKSNPICLAISLLSWLCMAPNTQHLAAQQHPLKQDNPQELSKQKKTGKRADFRLSLQTHLWPLLSHCSFVPKTGVIRGRTVLWSSSFELPPQTPTQIFDFMLTTEPTFEWLFYLHKKAACSASAASVPASSSVW